jgi:hypothetical protein
MNKFRILLKLKKIKNKKIKEQREKSLIQLAQKLKVSIDRSRSLKGNIIEDILVKKIETVYWKYVLNFGFVIIGFVGLVILGKLFFELI